MVLQEVLPAVHNRRGPVVVGVVVGLIRHLDPGLAHRGKRPWVAAKIERLGDGRSEVRDGALEVDHGEVVSLEQTAQTRPGPGVPVDPEVRDVAWFDVDVAGSMDDELPPLGRGRAGARPGNCGRGWGDVSRCGAVRGGRPLLATRGRGSIGE